MSNKVVGLSSNLPEKLYPSAHLPLELIQLAGRVDGAACPPPLLAERLLSGLAPERVTLKDPDLEDNGVDRHGPRGAGAAISWSSASSHQPMSVSSSSSSSSALQDPWAGVPNYFKMQLTDIVADIQARANAPYDDALGEDKRRLVKRMDRYYKDVMKYLDKDGVLDSVIAYIVELNKISIIQKQNHKGSGRIAKFFHEHEEFSNWLTEIQKKLQGERFKRFQKEAIEPFSKKSPGQEVLKKCLTTIKNDLIALLHTAEHPPSNRTEKQNRKYVASKKDLFVKRSNELVERVQQCPADPEIMGLVQDVKTEINRIAGWQTRTQKPNQTGIVRGVKNFSDLCPGLEALLHPEGALEQVVDLPAQPPKNSMGERIEMAAGHLESFMMEDDYIGLSAMDKNSLASPQYITRAKALQRGARLAKQHHVRNGLLGKYLKSKEGSANPVEEAPLAERLAAAFNEISEFQSRCPEAKLILGFYDTFPDYAESLREHLSAAAAVFAPSPASGPKSKKGIGQVPHGRTKKPIVRIESESSESESFSVGSVIGARRSKRPRLGDSSDDESPRSVRVVGSKRNRPESAGTDSAPKRARVMQVEPAMDLVQPDEERHIPSFCVAPTLQTRSLEERYNDLLVRLKNSPKNLAPGFSIKWIHSREELVIDQLDFYDLYFKKTPEEKIAVIAAYIEKLKNQLGQVWRSDEEESQKRAFTCQIVKAFHDLSSRTTMIEWGAIEGSAAGFAEALNSLLVRDPQLQPLFGNKSFSMLFPSFTSHCIAKGDAALLRRIFTRNEIQLLAL